MDYNFTLANPFVKEFFKEGSKEPSAALISMYQFLHEHPLVTPSFLTEIKDIVDQTALHLQKRKVVSQTVLQPMIDATIGIANNLPNDNPKQGLIHLRELYNVCISLQTL